MSRFTVNETIDRPVDEVWAFATDWSRAPRWMSGVDSMRVEGDGPVAEGSRIVFEARGAERESTIVRWTPPRCVAMRSVQGGVTATYVYSFSSTDDGGTRIELEATCEFRGAIKLLGPLIGWAVRRTDGGQLRDLVAAMRAEG